MSEKQEKRVWVKLLKNYADPVHGGGVAGSDKELPEGEAKAMEKAGVCDIIAEVPPPPVADGIADASEESEKVTRQRTVDAEKRDEKRTK